MKKRTLVFVLPLLTLLLEALPYGAVLRFGRPASDGSIGHFRELYSYFDLTPFGYGSFAPLFTAVTTCVILLLLAAYGLTWNVKLASAARGLTAVGAVLSLCPLLLGLSLYSLVGALITASLLAELFLLHAMLRPAKGESGPFPV